MCLWAYKCVCVQSFLYRDLLSLNLFCTRGLSQKISVFLLYYFWSLSPFPAQSSQDPWNFLSEEINKNAFVMLTR